VAPPQLGPGAQSVHRVGDLSHGFRDILVAVGDESTMAAACRAALEAGVQPGEAESIIPAVIKDALLVAGQVA
jgi:hypothetical protein